MTGSIATRQLHARQRAIALAVSIAIPLEFISILVFSWNHKTSPVLFGAAAVDSVIFCGGALWILSRWAGGYAQLGLTPRRWLKMFAMAAVISSAVGWVLRIPEIIVVRWLVVSAELAFTAVILFAIIRTARALPREGFWNQVRLNLSQHLPSIVVELGTTELELLSAGVRSLIRPRVDPDQGVFTTLRTSQSGFVLPFIALVSLVEMPALHIALRFWLHSSYVAHAALLGLHLYGLLWLLGDRRLIRETGHRLTPDGLDICLGRRWRCAVPYRQIHKLGLQPQPPPRAGRDTRDVTPWDKPNVHLCLAAPATLVGYFGLRRRATHLRLFVDSPLDFVAALKQRIEEKRAASAG